MNLKSNISRAGCSCCFFLEMIDGVPFCNYLEVDVALEWSCENFCNNSRVREILQTYNLYLSEKGVENFFEEIEGV